MNRLMVWHFVGHLVLLWMSSSVYTATWFFDEQREISKNNLLTTIPKLLKTAEIHFEFKANNFQEGFTNVIHLTATDNNCCNVGDRIASVWLYKEGSVNQLMACSYVANNGNYCFTSSFKFPAGQWVHLEVGQKRMGQRHRFIVRVNYRTVGMTLHRSGRDFENVRVYVSNPWNDNANGSLRMLTIVGPLTKQPSPRLHRKKDIPLSKKSSPQVQSTSPAPSVAPIPTITLKDKTVYQSENNTQIECAFSNETLANFTWSFNGVAIRNSYIDVVDKCGNKSGYFQLAHRLNVLVICGMNFSIHQGVFTCGVNSKFGLISKNMYLAILAKPAKPVVVPSSIFLPYNTWRIVTCLVRSNPKAHFKWVKVENSTSEKEENEDSITSDQAHEYRKVISETDQLNLTWAIGSGQYQCVASNHLGVSSTSFHVKVGPKPLIPTITLEDKTVHQSDNNTYIECVFSNETSANFTWSFNGVFLRSSYIQEMNECENKSGFFQLFHRPYVLVICQIDFTVHQGNYTCGVDSRYGFVSKDMTLTVLAKPTKPVVVPSFVFVPHNTWKIVTCSVTSNPKAAITWMKKLTPVWDKESLNHTRPVSPLPVMSRRSRLNITWTMGAGEYQCQAENYLGRSWTTLLVKVGPEPPPSVSVMGSRSDSSDDPSRKVVIGLAFGFGSSLIMCVLIVVHHIHRRNLRFAPLLEPDEEFNLDPNQSIQDQAAKLPYNVSWEFPRIDITLVRLVGTGYYGKVWESLAEGIGAFNPLDESDLSLKSKIANIHKRCPANDYFVKYFRKQLYPPNHSKQETVAVKCIKEYAKEEDYAAMAAELKIMIHIGRHKNIVNLLGACTLDGPLWLILEFCPYGDLLKFLRKRNKLFYPKWDCELDTPPESINILNLMKMAIDISEGMCFLSSHSVVHRDLSARNILVGEEMQVKIADFGMARQVGKTGEEYHMESEDVLPVRWMSLEALQLGTFTTSSDAWSFGIVIWEMFTMGVRPYPGLSNQDIFNFLQKGKRMEPPIHCPPLVVEIMKCCWERNPEDRPTFSKITDSLREVVRDAFAPPADYYTGSINQNQPKAVRAPGLNTPKQARARNQTQPKPAKKSDQNQPKAVRTRNPKQAKALEVSDQKQPKVSTNDAATSTFPLNNSAASVVLDEQIDDRTLTLVAPHDNKEYVRVLNRAVKRKRRLGDRATGRKEDNVLFSYSNEIIDV